MNMRFFHFDEDRPVKGHTVNSIGQMELAVFQGLRPKITVNIKDRSCEPHGQTRGRFNA